MGTSASTQPLTGVKANPRVVYTDEISKKDKKSYILDAPVLVDVQHGSVRYRYGKYEGEPGNKARRIERPFEGEDRVNKQHYFYHARLNDFSEKASNDKEEPNKFMMVTKGPNSAHNKKLFYVYGIGLNTADGKRTLPTLSKEEGTDYAWPQTRKPNDVYYNLSFDHQGNK
ncbi:hypothetical protein FSP39_001979 [Pinctada imbricata]|uniref:Uncharacterized protein n=1 Tax=Pinctada imbricata TaxID=66713 RepID=A0AA89C066_PINIB|nr:hypothetical protein FSP39_001979 [Pinctada imbricata]